MMESAIRKLLRHVQCTSKTVQFFGNFMGSVELAEKHILLLKRCVCAVGCIVFPLILPFRKLHGLMWNCASFQIHRLAMTAENYYFMKANEFACHIFRWWLRRIRNRYSSGYQPL